MTTGGDDLTDADFVPRDEPDPIETLRRNIRIGLHQGSAPKQIIDGLIGQGMEPGYAAEMVRSVLQTGRRVEVTTHEWLINGVAVTKSVEKREVLTDRQRRLEQEAAKAATAALDEPNPDLAFDRPVAYQPPARRSPGGRMVKIAAVVALATAAVVLLMLR